MKRKLGRTYEMAEAENDAEEIAHGDPPEVAQVVECFHRADLDADPDSFGDLFLLTGADVADDVQAFAEAEGYDCADEQYRAEPQESEEEAAER